MLTLEDIEAIKLFTHLYPTWWYKIGVCDRSRDFDAAPQGNSPEAIYIKHNNVWDNGFSCDHTGSIADAVKDVIAQINQEKFNHNNNR